LCNCILKVARFMYWVFLLNLVRNQCAVMQGEKFSPIEMEEALLESLDRANRMNHVDESCTDIYTHAHWLVNLINRVMRKKIDTECSIS